MIKRFFKMVLQNTKYETQNTRSGFTLVEVVLALAVVGILAGLVGPAITSGIRQYALSMRQKVALSQARLAMERIGAEMLLIPATTSIDTWTSSVVQFDISGENNINYSLSGSNLQRSGVILASNVSSLSYTYLDANGNTATAQSDIRRIGYEIVVSAGTGYGSIRLRSQIFPRQFSPAYAGFQ